jgi:hypothetical protein
MHYGQSEERRRPTQRLACECGGRLICRVNAAGAKRGFRRIAKHDLCYRCYRAQLDRLKSAHPRDAGRRLHRKVQRDRVYRCVNGPHKSLGVQESK